MRPAAAALAALLAVAAGCSTGGNKQAVGGAGSPDKTAKADAQQVSGGIATGVKATVDTTGVGRDVTGYSSQFGVGATLVVSLTMLLTLVLSHVREMARIRSSRGQ